MKRSQPILTVGCALFAAVILCASTSQAQKSFDDKLDIAALMAQAEERFDLSKHDAVFLFDSRRVDWLADGRRELTIHRIIWISTDRGIELYGDHRVPFDHPDRCDLLRAFHRHLLMAVRKEHRVQAVLFPADIYGDSAAAAEAAYFSRLPSVGQGGEKTQEAGFGEQKHLLYRRRESEIPVY